MKKPVTREQWLNKAVKLMRPEFTRRGVTIPAKVRASCSWPSHKAIPKNGLAQAASIGQCWDKEASTDGHFEVFISPLLDKVPDVLQVLAHELCHTAVGTAAGHKAPFRKAATAIGLAGKMTATHAGPQFLEWTAGMLPKLGDYPHARIKPSYRPTKKQSTRMLKCECPGCGYIIRTTAKWADAGMPTCHCGEEFVADGAEEGDDE